METGPLIPASQASHLLSSFTTFLTLTLHTLLYHRALYPKTTFLTARALNLPVHQSRHPGLCTWINDAVASVAAQLRKGTVRRIAIAMHAAKTFDVLERWVFDVDLFPAGWGDREEATYNPTLVEGDDDGVVNWTDVNEALRGALRRIAQKAEMMPDLPKGSTFTVAVELRDGANAPIGHPQHWIPSQPNLQPPNDTSLKQGSSLGGQSTTAIRSVQAGPLFFNCWIEQSEPITS
ncbi:mitotic spindle assembly checkpoint MAD2 [Fusarium mundagurra]|uniref:Mitotic spindle assembly checkpoint MAD2 n=1 Tax=Fusarium mundagurra TaxID=1567541 RepID=A0A8H5YJP5_9HYPO|nr:mitotic spindle assembly checkpoint MAD2 [Fusarium mundagurra]